MTGNGFLLKQFVTKEFLFGFTTAFLRQKTLQLLPEHIRATGRYIHLSKEFPFVTSCLNN